MTPRDSTAQARHPASIDDAAPTVSTPWQLPGANDASGEEEALVVAIDGFEGPLDLLLALARTQKLDLAKMSIRALVDQYLAFIDDVRHLRLELAADYLVMAAWLAFLKSRLLLPKEAATAEELSADAMAQRLAFRLVRLDAMRKAAAALMARPRLGRDVQLRGMPEPVRTVRDTTRTAALYDVLRAYADVRRRTITVGHVVKARKVWSIREARARLETMVGVEPEGWLQLDLFVARYLPEVVPDPVAADPATDAGPLPEATVAGPEATPLPVPAAPPDVDPRTVMAASFGATLEMTREGLIDVHQDAPFAPIQIRRRVPAAPTMAAPTPTASTPTAPTLVVTQAPPTPAQPAPDAPATTPSLPATARRAPFLALLTKVPDGVSG